MTRKSISMSDINTVKTRAKRYCLITAGCASLGAGIALFLEPNRLAPGGVSGVAIILSRFVPLHTGLLMLLLNIPLLVLGGVVFGRHFLFSTVYGAVMLSVFTDLIDYICGRFGVAGATQDLFLASVFGGLLTAVGLGLVFRCDSTTGGLDIVVRLLHAKLGNVSVGFLFLAVDFAVAGVSAVVFRSPETGMYATVTILLYSFLTDVVIAGRRGKRMTPRNDAEGEPVSDRPETV